ncbi:MAG: hypothetical protein WBE61_09115, partial [Nitrososphaeraceae archaeon]
EFYDKGNGPVQIAIQLGPFRKASNPVLRKVLEGLRCVYKLCSVYKELKELKGKPFVPSETADC